MSHKGSKADDKRAQWWSSISKEKLDALRWTMLHSGLNVAGLQNDDGFTGIQVAAMSDKPKALLVILDILRQKRELAEAIDVPTDEKGMSPLMLACQKGAEKCAEHLIYYGASLTKKSEAGLTARDYAVRGKYNAIAEMIDEELGVGTAAAGAVEEEAVDADGMTSTQRNRLKKKQLREAANKGMLAAIAAAGGADGEGAGAGSEGAAAAGAGPAAAPLPFGMTALAAARPEPVWAELKTAVVEKRRELTVSHVAAAAGAEEAPAAAGAGSDVPAAGATTAVSTAEPGFIDPALWYHSILNRLELRVPGLTVLPDAIGHLSALQTLILSRNALTALPESLGALTELKFLDASSNALTELPASLGKLPKLEVLDLANNKLTTLAPLAPLTSLVSLLADGNELVEVPLNYAGLVRLETLSLSHNKLAELPEEVGALGNLSVLNVSSNELVELPSGLSELKEKKIKELKLLPNPFADKKMVSGRGTRRAVAGLFSFSPWALLAGPRAHPAHVLCSPASLLPCSLKSSTATGLRSW